MAEKTILGTTSNNYINAKVIWSVLSSDSVNNTSTITATLYYKAKSSYYSTSGRGNFSIAIGNVKESGTANISITSSDWVKACEITRTVTHEPDGSLDITISASGSMPEASPLSFTSTTLSKTVSLPILWIEGSTISIPDTSCYHDEEIRYEYTVHHPWVYNALRIYCYGLDGITEVILKTFLLGKQPVSTHTATITFSESEVLKIFAEEPNTPRAAVYFEMSTYSDSEYSVPLRQLGVSEGTVLLNLRSTAATIPTATMILSPVHSLSSRFDDVYVQGKSKVVATFKNVASKYGATIESYGIYLRNKNVSYFSTGFPLPSEYSLQSKYLNTAGNVIVKGTVTDSRGFELNLEQSITVIPYASPTILPASGENSIVCARCDEYGELSKSGTYLKIKAKRRYSKVLSSDAQKNFCSIRYRYKETSATHYSDWETILASTVTNDEVETDPLLNEGLSASKSYLVQIGVIDTIGETHTVTLTVPTARVYMHRAGSLNSLGIGKYVEEENTIDIAEKLATKFRGKVIFDGEHWEPLGLLFENVTVPDTDYGHGEGAGCYYRVCAGGTHICVSFNCKVYYGGTATRVNALLIPEEFRPKRNVYAICAADGLAIARVYVNTYGDIGIDWVQKLTDATESVSEEFAWIDGYIDYWI